MPALTGVSATGGRGSVSSVNVTIGLRGVRATVVPGIISKSIGSGNVLSLKPSLPQLAMYGSVDQLAQLAIALPQAQLAMTGQTALKGALALATPHITLAMQGITGATGTLALHVPAVTLTMAGGAGLKLTVPAAQLVMAGTQGALAQLTLAAPRPALAMTGDAPQIGKLTLTPTLPVLRLAGQVGTSAQLALRTPQPALVMSGSVDVAGTLAIALPAVKFALQGSFAAVGALALSAPLIKLLMTGVVAGTTAQVAAARTTVAIQTERLALTQYTNFPFNSFAVFGGRYLGASDAGIFELTGGTDAGVPIDARARTGVSDLNTSQIKRLDRVYLGYRAVGRLQVWVTVNESITRGYAAPPSDDRLRGAHVRLGKGVEARYWQFEVRNENGGDFTLDTLEVKPTILPRRTGSGDA